VRAIAVIGAGFGDEGKGVMTDFLVHQYGDPRDTVVVRFNGGAQAGHTVVTPEGQRHVFHHFGSGTFLGAPTYLSRFFVVNPLYWREELKELKASGIDPILYVDFDAILTTPYDMLINQEKEKLRGSERHGSCGAGIHETVARCATQYRTTVIDGFHNLEDKMLSIRYGWVHDRMKDLTPSEEFWKRINSEEILDDFLVVVKEFIKSVGLYGRIPPAKYVIFEGAQGLLLDEDLVKFSPYITHSKTGTRNVAILAKENRIENVNVVYVIRSYMTRHGAGPFPTEKSALSFLDVTNAPNEWQGGLRFGTLDYGLINGAVREDMQHLKGIKGGCVMAITHCDQSGSHRSYNFYLPTKYGVWGPTREDVRS